MLATGQAPSVGSMVERDSMKERKEMQAIAIQKDNNWASLEKILRLEIRMVTAVLCGNRMEKKVIEAILDGIQETGA